MSMGDLHTLATLFAFIAFIGVAWWAYSPKNKQRFEDDARLALDEDVIVGRDNKSTTTFKPRDEDVR